MALIHALKRRFPVRRTIAKRAPKLWAAYLDLRHHREVELALLPDLVRGDLASVDVGANIGTYTRRLAKLCPRVFAFEPHEPTAALLKGSSAKNVIIYQFALSDRDHVAELLVPTFSSFENGGLASLEESREDNTFFPPDQPYVAKPVEARTMDGLITEPVGFMKIDVEGHELKVLMGARSILAKHKPVLLIECIGRKHLEAVATFLESIGYQGSYFRHGAFHDMGQFDFVVLQNAANVLESGARKKGTEYINNFIFR